MDRILIMSDTHGSLSFEDIIKKENPLYVLHAGDSQLIKNDEVLTYVNYIVRGNCDYENFKENLIFSIPNIGNIYLTHGHFEGVKMNISNLIYTALENNINLCVYGHTHVVHVEYIKENDLLIVNPGSTVFGRSKYKNTYIVLEYSKSTYNVILKNSETYKVIDTFIYTRGVD